MSAPGERPYDVAHLADMIVEHSGLRGPRRARLVADLREHLDDAQLAGRSPESIIATFGDPVFVAALVRRSPPATRDMRHLWVAVAASLLLMTGLYAESAIRLGTFAHEPELAAIATFTDSAALHVWFRDAARSPSKEPDSLARALRIARNLKGVQARSLGARLLEPVYFARASSSEDVWPVVLAARRRGSVHW